MYLPPKGPGSELVGEVLGYPMQESQSPGLHDSGFSPRKRRPSPSYAGARTEVAIRLHEGPITLWLACSYTKQ